MSKQRPSREQRFQCGRLCQVCYMHRLHLSKLVVLPGLQRLLNSKDQISVNSTSLTNTQGRARRLTSD